MSRVPLTLTVFLGLAAWAGAQGPPAGLTAAENLDRLKANRALLDQLIDRGIELGGAGNPVDRAEACQRTAGSLAYWVGLAAADQNPDRVAELGGHLEAVIRDGLVPNLDEGRRTVTLESAARLDAAREKARGDLDRLRDALAAPGKVADSRRVKDLRGKLDALYDRLK
jgi:hypothetical protein